MEAPANGARGILTPVSVARDKENEEIERHNLKLVTATIDECNKAGLPELSALFINQRLGLSAVRERLNEAAKIRALCQQYGVENRVSVYMRAGLTLDDVEAELVRDFSLTTADGEKVTLEQAKKIVQERHRIYEAVAAARLPREIAGRFIAENIPLDQVRRRLFNYLIQAGGPEIDNKLGPDGIHPKPAPKIDYKEILHPPPAETESGARRTQVSLGVSAMSICLHCHQRLQPLRTKNFRCRVCGHDTGEQYVVVKYPSPDRRVFRPDVICRQCVQSVITLEENEEVVTPEIINRIWQRRLSQQEG